MNAGAGLSGTKVFARALQSERKSRTRIRQETRPRHRNLRLELLRKFPQDHQCLDISVDHSDAYRTRPASCHVLLEVASFVRTGSASF